MKKPTMKEVLARLEAAEKRIKELEAVAHPQHVMADPVLTEAIKQLAERFAPPRVPEHIEWHPTWQPHWPSPVIC
jgi:hypothetical protein